MYLKKSSLIEPGMLTQMVVEVVYAFPTDIQVGTIQYVLHYITSVDPNQLSLGLIDYYKFVIATLF